MPPVKEYWTPVSAGMMPAKGVLIRWLSPGGDVLIGRYLGGIVWMPEGSSAYVYYTPTYWQLASTEKG